jgi:hypothetical protein
VILLLRRNFASHALLDHRYEYNSNYCSHIYVHNRLLSSISLFRVSAADVVMIDDVDKLNLSSSQIVIETHSIIHGLRLDAL